MSWEKKMNTKKAQKKIKTTDRVNCPLGDSFIPSMKSQNGIFWMVHWWVLAHSNPQHYKKLLIYIVIVTTHHTSQKAFHLGN
jgi:hypothetical protein